MATRNDDLLAQLRRVVFPSALADADDEQLLTRFVERRDVEAAAILVRRHGPMVWGVCRRVLAHPQDAEDAFQATFLVFVRKAASVAPRNMVGNWLYGVARQTARKARQSAAARRTREGSFADVPDVASPASGGRNDAALVLDRELSQLPDIYRAAIVLCELEGQSRSRAARQLGVPEGTLAARLFRGREMLAKRLARHGLGAGAIAALSENAPAMTVQPPLVTAAIHAVRLLTTDPATAPISANVRFLANGVLNAMIIVKLKSAFIVLVVAGLLSSAGGWLYREAHAAQESSLPAAKVPATNPPQDGDNAKPPLPRGADKKGDKKEALKKNGAFRAQIEKVDAGEGVITVFRLGTLVAGSVGPKGGVGQFKNNIRLENLPVAKAAPIAINGNPAQLADLKPAMRVTLELEVKGDITIKAIHAEK